MQAGQRQHREENQRDDERRINDRRANFERGVQDDAEDGARLGAGLIFPEPAEDVLHVDDRVVHHFADGNGQAAEGDGVERHATFVEQDDRREQR